MYFFLHDAAHKLKLFSSEKPDEIPVRISRTRKAWEIAKKKLLLLPAATMVQEQTFIGALKSRDRPIRIACSSGRHEKRIKVKFFLFLQRQRSLHILFLVVELLLLPISGLAVILPGPNIFFYALALITITHWQALRGIGRLSRSEHDFIPESLISEWEDAVDSGNVGSYPDILKRLEGELGLPQAEKILGIGKSRRKSSRPSSRRD